MSDPRRGDSTQAAVAGATRRGPAYLVSDDGQLRVTRLGREPTLILAGEIDEYSYRGLIRALACAAQDPGEIHVDLGNVGYCDVAGLRAVVLLAADQCDGPVARRVVLHRVPEPLMTGLRILGWDTNPGLILDETGRSAPGGPDGPG